MYSKSQIKQFVCHLEYSGVSISNRTCQLWRRLPIIAESQTALTKCKVLVVLQRP